jgi:hypothetical protein
MRGLDPRIHLFRKKSLRRSMDCRVKPGNDEGRCSRIWRLTRSSCTGPCKEQAGNRETEPAIVSHSRRLVLTRVPARRSVKRSVTVRCRPGTVPVCGGPGSAMHRSTSLRAASHPGHTSLGRRVRSLIHFSNSPSRSRGAFLRPGFASLLHSPRTEGWAERRETFGCFGTRWAYHDAIRQAPSEAPCVP